MSNTLGTCFGVFIHTQWAPPFTQQYLAPFSSLAPRSPPPARVQGSVCAGDRDGFNEQTRNGKLKSQGDNACFAEQKGGCFFFFLNLPDRKGPVAVCFLGHIILISHDAWGFFFSLPFLLWWGSAVLKGYVCESSLGLPRRLISNLVSWEVAGVGFGGRSFKPKCSIAILSNFNSPSVLSSYRYMLSIWILNVYLKKWPNVIIPRDGKAKLRG